MDDEIADDWNWVRDEAGGIANEIGMVNSELRSDEWKNDTWA